MAFIIDSVVHGCRIYKDIWNAEIDSELSHIPQGLPITGASMPLGRHDIIKHARYTGYTDILT